MICINDLPKQLPRTDPCDICIITVVCDEWCMTKKIFDFLIPWRKMDVIYENNRGEDEKTRMEIKFDDDKEILDNIPPEDPCSICIVTATCDQLNDMCVSKVIFLTFGAKGDMKNENQNRLCNKQQLSISLGSDSGQF